MTLGILGVTGWIGFVYYFVVHTLVRTLHVQPCSLGMAPVSDLLGAVGERAAVHQGPGALDAVSSHQVGSEAAHHHVLPSRS